MSTSIYNPSQDLRRSSTTSRHRRSSVSLHSTPGLGLIKTISRDLVHGWHTPTALQKERPSSPSLAPASRAYKPRHAARDAMKSFTPVASHQADTAQEAANSYFGNPKQSFITTLSTRFSSAYLSHHGRCD
ncbi:unnamed protein product [Aureobasidium mustum]|uniref:Uncharacterized protein n=1 Tax=Aureobasidium mustum TaxID=2773714 RepID=A0A9N8PJR3_9PEZI|nr:unnamed protein product [Aureobasidium mustum]